MTEVVPQHERLRELVAAFADGELTGEERRAVEEHLRWCPACRRELELQQGVSAGLGRDYLPPLASIALRRRIEWMGEPVAQNDEGPLPRARRWAGPLLASVVFLAVAGATAVRLGRSAGSTPAREIPLVRDALADCRRAIARNFPRQADLRALAEGTQFAIPVLDHPDVRLFSTWKTTVAGVPAAALAYRWRGIVVVEYALPAELLRRQPEIGKALDSAGFYASSEWGQNVVAMLRDGSGTVLVAEAPAEELRRLIL